MQMYLRFQKQGAAITKNLKKFHYAAVLSFLILLRISINIWLFLERKQIKLKAINLINILKFNRNSIGRTEDYIFRIIQLKQTDNN